MRTAQRKLLYSPATASLFNPIMAVIVAVCLWPVYPNHELEDPEPQRIFRVD